MLDKIDDTCYNGGISLAEVISVVDLSYILVSLILCFQIGMKLFFVENSFSLSEKGGSKMMPAIPTDYSKLNALTEKLGVIWEMSPDSSPDSRQATIVLKAKPSGARPCERTSNPLDVANTVDLLTFLFDVGLLTDVGQPAILQRLENLEKECSSGSADTVSATITLEERVTALNKRAQRIGNGVIFYGQGVAYNRNRRKNPQAGRWRVMFTMDDMPPVYRKREHRQGCWFFSEDELDLLEELIAHDEGLYSEYCSD